MKAKPIYVEIPMKAEIEEVWDRSQDPKLHEQWDLRFSSITYLTKESEDEPQSFLYETKIGFGLKVSGWGKSMGTYDKKDGSRSSSLHFGTDQKISPIREGRGYWRYVPAEEGSTFLTQYDYDVRYGIIGRLLDLLFRPLMGWATALSFDVLKRWMEKGEAPRSQYLRFFISALISALFFFVWFYQGLVPKIIENHPAEVSMLSGLSAILGDSAIQAVMIIGFLEMLFALLWLFYRKKKHLMALQMVIFPALTFASIAAEPSIAFHPFNPVSFNMSLWILSIIGFFVSADLPSASSCKRRRKED
ncbi:DoxX-like family protein [Peribacillus sp. SCS-26]|uniref:DoxX-like family protein n=1 Tax=Paraperibacillus marinus TaxID=3115295 RepID=UPI003906B7EF